MRASSHQILIQENMPTQGNCDGVHATLAYLVQTSSIIIDYCNAATLNFQCSFGLRHDRKKIKKIANISSLKDWCVKLESHSDQQAVVRSMVAPLQESARCSSSPS